MSRQLGDAFLLALDHLTIIAPSLAEGVAHVCACLGVDMPFGGAHPEMATHNHLLRLGDDVFLEIIAVDAMATRPARARWFGLDDAATVRRAWDDGLRLRAWVARSDDLDRLLTLHGEMLGGKTRVSRGDRTWFFAVRDDGALPAGGAAPCVIDWGPRGTPAPAMPDLGAHLKSFTIEHPEPGRVTQLYADLGIRNPPNVQKGTRLCYRAVIETAGGVKELT